MALDLDALDAQFLAQQAAAKPQVRASDIASLFASEPEAPAEPSELSNALADFADENQGLAYGAAGGLGDMLGWDWLRDKGYEGYERNMQEVAGRQRDAYNIDYLAEQGTVGDWVDALQYHGIKGGLNLITTLASGGIGSAIAKRAAASAIKRKMAGEITEDVAQKQIDDIARAGQLGWYGGAAANAYGMELGETWGQAAEEQMRRSGNIDNIDLMKVTQGGLAAGSLEFAGDVATLGLSKMLPGKEGVLQGLMQRPSALGRVGIGAAVNAPIEGLTERGQHFFETWGADKPTYGEEYEAGARQAMFAGAVGGAAAGGTINLMNRPAQQEPPTV
ncbi:MAG: hypothetical protein H7842_12485, partial [Gammaproteobacteria bacterium SHHR-1]